MTLLVNPSFNFCKRDDGVNEAFEDGSNEAKSGRVSSSHSTFGWVEADENDVLSTV